MCCTLWCIFEYWSKPVQQCPEVKSSTAWWKGNSMCTLVLDWPVEWQAQKLQVVQQPQTVLDTDPGQRGLEKNQDNQQDCSGILVVVLQAATSLMLQPSLTSWCQDNCLSLNVSKTKELIVDFRKTPAALHSSCDQRDLGVNISEDLTWTAHIQTQVKKARQRLYHLRQLRKFRVSPTILKTFYAGTIESVLTQCISVWYGNSSSQDCKALQRVVRLAERISGSALPSLQDIYLKRCRSRAVKIIKDSNHPGNCLFTLLPSGKRFRSLMAKTERLRRSFFPKAIRLLNSNSAS